MELKLTSKLWLRGLLIVGSAGIFAAIYAALQILFDGYPLNTYVRAVASFACFGFLLGGIYAFDSDSDVKLRNYPLLRAVIGCVSGVSIGFIWSWPSEGIALAALIAILLGLLGMAWAKYIDF